MSLEPVELVKWFKGCEILHESFGENYSIEKGLRKKEKRDFEE